MSYWIFLQAEEREEDQRQHESFPDMMKITIYSSKKSSLPMLNFTFPVRKTRILEL